MAGVTDTTIQAITTEVGTTVTIVTDIGIAEAITNMHAIVGVLVGLVAFASAALALSPGAPLPTFPTEIQARQHCPKETVVWLNLLTGVYHYRDQRWYGNTSDGAYACRSEADQARDQALKKSQ